MKKECVSQDGTKKIVFEESRGSTLRIKSTKTNEVIYERHDAGGWHNAEAFSQDGEKVLYLSHCRYGYVNPYVKVWDFERGVFWSVMSKHHRAIGIIAEFHSDDLSIVILADTDGEVSLIHPYEKRVVWHRKLAVEERVRIDGFKLTEDEGVVWVFHDKGIEALSLGDGCAQSVHQLPSEYCAQ